MRDLLSVVLNDFGEPGAACGSRRARSSSLPPPACPAAQPGALDRVPMRIAACSRARRPAASCRRLPPPAASRCSACLPAGYGDLIGEEDAQDALDRYCEVGPQRATVAVAGPRCAILCKPPESTARCNVSTPVSGAWRATACSGSCHRQCHRQRVSGLAAAQAEWLWRRRWSGGGRCRWRYRGRRLCQPRL